MPVYACMLVVTVPVEQIKSGRDKLVHYTYMLPDLQSLMKLASKSVYKNTHTKKNFECITTHEGNYS